MYVHKSTSYSYANERAEPTHIAVDANKFA